jgi:hypothetical protein
MSAAPLPPPRRIGSRRYVVPLTRLYLTIYCDAHSTLYTCEFSGPTNRVVPCLTLRLACGAAIRHSGLRQNRPATRRERATRLMLHTS